MKLKLMLIKILFFSFFIFFYNAADSFAQKRDPKKELLVYILRDSLEIPNNGKREINFKDAIIHSKSLEAILKTINSISIRKTFPDEDPADSIKITEDGRKIKTPSFHRIFTITFNDEKEADEAILKLKKVKAVLYVHKNIQPLLNGTENLEVHPPSPDPNYASGVQWHLKNDGRNSGTIDADINAEAAWNIFTGSSAIKIAIFDTGVDLSHEELSGKITGDAPPSNAYSHGTHVAGIAAGYANNGKGGRGVDWNAQIISKNILAPVVLNDSLIASSVKTITNGTAQIQNHSWGGPNYNETLGAAFAYAYKMNRTVIASSGNDGLATTLYPAGFKNVITVSATDNNDLIASYSNTGNHIDVAAPGGNSLSTTASTSIFSSNPSNNYGYNAGTSMAAPQVSGLASLLKGYNNNLYNDDIEKIIKISAEKVGIKPYVNGWNDELGYGRLDAGNALNLVKAPNSVTHLTATGGTVVFTTSSYTSSFMDVNSIANGSYTVKINEVTKAITFPTTYCNIIDVWGTGLNSNGFRFDPGKTIFGEGFCEVVPGTLTTTGVTLRTYVYELFDASNVSMGFYPTTPANVTFGYSILGKKTVDVSMTIEPQLNNGTCGDANVSINTSGGTFVWTVTGDLLINGSSTTLTTTSNAITVTGTSGTITVTGGDCPGLNLSEIYNPYKRDIQFSGSLPLLPSDQLSVSISNLNYGVDTFKWYVNNNLVYSGTNDNYCTCNPGTDYRICGINTLRVEADLPCGKTVVIADIEFEQLCGGWFSYYTIYPNPASSNLYIAPNEEKMRTMPAFEKAKIKEYEVSLYDIKGKLRMKAKSSNYKVELDTKSLPSDTYFLHLVKDGDKEVIKKQVMIKN